MLDHITYDKIRIIYELSRILWFIEKHAKQDAQNIKDLECYDNFEKIAQDLEKHIALLKKDLDL